IQRPLVYVAIEQERHQTWHFAWFGAARPEASVARQRQGSSSRAVADHCGFESAGFEAVAQSGAGCLEDKDRSQRLIPCAFSDQFSPSWRGILLWSFLFRSCPAPSPSPSPP